MARDRRELADAALAGRGREGALGGIWPAQTLPSRRDAPLSGGAHLGLGRARSLPRHRGVAPRHYLELRVASVHRHAQGQAEARHRPALAQRARAEAELPLRVSVGAQAARQAERFHVQPRPDGRLPPHRLPRGRRGLLHLRAGDGRGHGVPQHERLELRLDTVAVDLHVSDARRRLLPAQPRGGAGEGGQASAVRHQLGAGGRQRRAHATVARRLRLLPQGCGARRPGLPGGVRGGVRRARLGLERLRASRPKTQRPEGPARPDAAAQRPPGLRHRLGARALPPHGEARGGAGRAGNGADLPLSAAAAARLPPPPAA